jgi:Raf kinase inhibitor-like YbhB/YbcL family protein
MKSHGSRFLIALIAFALLPFVFAQAQPPSNIVGSQPHTMVVTSTTFANGSIIPLTAVWNQCTFFPGGGNQSPQLSWSGVPQNTRSFIVVMYDITASFTHWGMYNIAATTTSLPQNAGVSGSSYGTQIANDYGLGDRSYDGPCPPPGLMPAVHHYVFTVYALNTKLPPLPTYGDFPPGAEALYQAMIAAARGGSILDSASISGFFP